MRIAFRKGEEMTNLEKMNKLVGTNATKEKVKSWAYNNRITVIMLHLDNEKFSVMENSVNDFVDSDLFSDDEFENWEKFLTSEFVV
jgi:hypothetical protein